MNRNSPTYAKNMCVSMLEYTVTVCNEIKVKPALEIKKLLLPIFPEKLFNKSLNSLISEYNRPDIVKVFTNFKNELEELEALERSGKK